MGLYMGIKKPVRRLAVTQVLQKREENFFPDSFQGHMARYELRLSGGEDPLKETGRRFPRSL